MATRCLGFATLVLTANILVLEISAQDECVVEKKFSIEKTLYVAKICHSQNIPTDTCGSYIIPPHSALPKA
ncbi:hypothetical protein QL285_029934 [Trifolium repens]|nr:hypothetical protein QL285_029934 [Trifolium repens]